MKIRMKTQYEGSLTIFFAMIFLFIAAFFLSLLALGRQQLMKVGVRQDLDAAGFSVLAEYDQDWVEEYGLYVLPRGRIQEGMRFYMEQNSERGWGHYQVDELTLKQADSLQDPAVLQKQILSFMKERGIVGIVEEVMEMIGQVEDSQKRTEELDAEHLEELSQAQALYAQLVTDLEGIQEDGSRNPYSIHHLLEEDPSLTEVQSALAKAQITSEELGCLERAYDEMDQVALLCGHAADTGQELEKLLLQMENAEMLPITADELKKAQRIWKDDKRLCEEASDAVQQWIRQMQTADLSEENPALLAARQKVANLSDYDRSVVLPYEYREGSTHWNFNKILAFLKGYPLEMGETAPDTERQLDLPGQLDLPEEAEDTGESLDWEQIGASSEFSDAVLTTEYILGIFRNFAESTAQYQGAGQPLNLRGAVKQNRFFLNEAEYLVMGKNNEYRNVDGTRNKIVLLRSLLNMAYLLTNTEKRAEIETLASATGGILLPGIGNGIAFGMILTIWSMGEATADYKLLTEGGRVPLWKDAESWQTDIESLLSLSLPEGGGQERGKGLSYAQYLRLILYTVDQDLLLQRVQNLLYLNHNRQSLDEMVTDFCLEGTVEAAGTRLSFAGEYGYDAFFE